jgi:hypothetical protein
MRDVEIIQDLKSKLNAPSGRHLYGVLGTYPKLKEFSEKLVEANFAKPISINIGILESIPDEDFRNLAESESKMPEPTANHVKQAFEKYIRSYLSNDGLVTLCDLELLFPYQIDFNLLRTLAADDFKVLLLLRGERRGDRIIMFPGLTEYQYEIPISLLSENHLWEIK